MTTTPMHQSEEANENEQHIYIDTVYLIHYLMGNGDEVSRARKQVIKAKQMVEKNSDIHVKIPFVATGEFINQICYNRMGLSEKSAILSKFFDLFKNMNIDFIPARVDSFRLAAQIKDRDRRLDDTDILIVAQALCDLNSTFLLTNDPDLIGSRTIGQVEKEIEGRRHVLKILEAI